MTELLYVNIRLIRNGPLHRHSNFLRFPAGSSRRSSTMSPTASKIGDPSPKKTFAILRVFWDMWVVVCWTARDHV
jgi:hypothetical protein